MKRLEIILLNVFDYYNNVFKELQKTVELLVEFSGEDCIPVSY